MPSFTYTQGKYLLATETLGWGVVSTTIRALLVSDTYVFNSAHYSVSDVAAHEVSGAIYSRVSVQNRTITKDIVNDRVLFQASNLFFASLSVTSSPSGAILYKQGGGDDNSPDDDYLLCFVDIPTTPSDGSDYIVEFDPYGVFTLANC